MSRTNRTLRRFLPLLLFVFVAAIGTSAQTTSFTYQGRLTDAGNPANGNYDLRFTLWDSLSGGTQVGSTQTVNAVAVSNGVFTVSIDFGATAFNGASRFLEIGAQPAGGGGFTTLSPRQQITSTPYAVRSLNASSADTVVTSGLPPGNGNYIQNSIGQQASSNFNISGSGIAGDTLSGNVVNAATQFNLGGNRVLSADNFFSNLSIGPGSKLASTGAGSSNTFVGARTGQSNAGSGNSFFGSFAGLNSVSGSYNSFLGASAGLFDSDGRSNTAIGALADMGSSNLINATAIGASARVDQSNSMVLGMIKTTGGFDTNVGIGTTAPQSRLHVNGTGWFSGDNTGDLQAAAGQGIAVGFVNNAGYIFAYNYGLGVGRKLVINGPSSDNSSASTEVGSYLDIDHYVDGGTISVCRLGARLAGCGSSLRYKTDVRTFATGLSLINRLRPISFNWKSNGKSDLGLAAEDVAKVEPLLVTYNDKGEVEGVKYDRVAVVLINAIKEQQTQIEQQQTQIKQQKEQIERERAATAAEQQELIALKNFVCRSHRRAGVCK